jgi:hypothetical protein
MHYLRKTPKSRVVGAGWRYPTHRRQIRDELLSEQRGFCAYSERFVQATDACDVEHFDPRQKGISADDYWNWYAVLRWMNSHKPPKIEPFLPILQPYSPDVPQRVAYEDGQFVAVRDGDAEAEHLIQYLGWNRPELAQDRSNHVRRVRDLRSFYDMEGFLAYLREHPQELSFITALTAEMGLDLAGLLPQDGAVSGDSAGLAS